MPLLFPKRRKYRKDQRGRRKGKAIAGSRVAFGEWGIQALESAWITAHQIEACRTTIVRQFGRGGKVWIRIFPDKPVTKTPAESRMGKGKGNPEDWVARVLPGRIMFEIAGVDQGRAKRIAELVSYKLPIKTRLRERIRLGGEE